jgi:hypothetical protein
MLLQHVCAFIDGDQVDPEGVAAIARGIQCESTALDVYRMLRLDGVSVVAHPVCLYSSMAYIRGYVDGLVCLRGRVDGVGNVGGNHAST